MKKYTAEDHRRYREQVEAQQRKEEEERREWTEKETSRRAWLREGGSAEDFEREWTKLRDEARWRRIAAADKEARRLQRSSGISKI
jgi:hypothetical protein